MKNRTKLKIIEEANKRLLRENHFDQSSFIEMLADFELSFEDDPIALNEIIGIYKDRIKLLSFEVSKLNGNAEAEEDEEIDDEPIERPNLDKFKGEDYSDLNRFSM